MKRLNLEYYVGMFGLTIIMLSLALWLAKNSNIILIHPVLCKIGIFICFSCIVMLSLRKLFKKYE